MSFASYGLSETVIQGIYGSGFCEPTEIQAKAIPLVLRGADIIGLAPTGTGKTAAFVIPILDRFVKTGGLKKNRRKPEALVLVPTRELALQLIESINLYGMYTGIRASAIYGGVGIGKQLKGLDEGTDIVVATPGRLIEHIERRSVSLSNISILVLDEADRMYDYGFVNEVRKIIACIPKSRQTLLFSATMSSEIKELTTSIQHKPQLVKIGNISEPVKTVEQHFLAVSEDEKFKLLIRILRNEKVESALVFCRTKYGADRITANLVKRGFSAVAIHADRTQAQRNVALEGFKKRKSKVLVATNLASRGLDIDRISHVINYDTPPQGEDYIHRIGRTGRADCAGTAYTFVSEEEEKFFRKIEQDTGNKFELEPCFE